ncbi:unnamed protein product [Hymenolepis diminuta]|uniref:Uncharacterized protein n=1 Tax=Hymenolepis diminuta TaxID=6216 RepID=A0A564YAU5_HYMDI|nr:unnamed protein product [Hymenolepis diminuta]
MHLSEAMKREAAFKGKTTASGCAADCNINLPGLDWIDMVNVLEQKIQSVSCPQMQIRDEAIRNCVRGHLGKVHTNYRQIISITRGKLCFNRKD